MFFMGQVFVFFPRIHLLQLSCKNCECNMRYKFSDDASLKNIYMIFVRACSFANFTISQSTFEWFKFERNSVIVPYLAGSMEL